MLINKKLANQQLNRSKWKERRIVAKHRNFKSKGYLGNNYLSPGTDILKYIQFLRVISMTP